MLHKGCKI